MGTSLPFPGPRCVLFVLLAALHWKGVVGEVCSVTKACCVPQKTMVVDENNAPGLVVSTITINKGPVKVINSPEDPVIAVDGTALKLTESIDFENLTSPVILFTLRCGDPLEDLPLIIQINNLNDNPPSFPEKILNFNISELFPVGETFKTVKANDLDRDPIFYRLDLNTSGAGYFKLKTPNTPELILTRTIDYEKTPSLQLILEAKENPKNNIPNDTVTININVQDGDNKPPVFEPCTPIPSSSASICYNAGYTGRLTINTEETGPLLLSPQHIEAVDGDRTINAKIEYAIAAGNHNNIFIIDKGSGAITMTKAVTNLDTIVLTVLAYQVDDPYKYATTTVTFNVLKTKKCSPLFEKEPYDGTIQGDAEPDSIVIGYGSASKPLAVQATDCDYPDKKNPSLRYEIAPSDYFTINRDGFIFTKTKLPPADSVHDLTVTATDDEYGETATTQVTVKVISNDAPTTTQGTGPSKPPINPPGPGPTNNGPSTPSKVPPGPPEPTTAKPPGPGSEPPTAPTTTQGTGPSKPPINPPGPGPTNNGPSTPSKVPPGPPEPTTAKPPRPGPTTIRPPNSPTVTGKPTTKPQLSGSTITANPGPPGPVTTPASKPPDGPGTGPTTSAPAVNPRLIYEAKHMAALGVPLALLLIICLVIIGILLRKIHKEKMEWEKIKEISSAKIKAFSRSSSSSKSDKMQLTNEGFLEEEKSEEPHKANWLPSKSAPIVESTALAAVLDPSVEKSSLTGSSENQTGPTSQRTKAAPTAHEDSKASSSLGETDNDAEVKSILTKERKSDEGYKSVWFKQDIEPEANEERVIERHDNEEEAEEDEGGRGDRGGGGESVVRLMQDDALSISL